ncbi:MAG: Re/Si-specific NAD(P)(+) transhydrogenase subunit alpha [Bacteroidetes bacterium]|nr:Re/Si-specific NAD(P)(+) transhydrogenase subunit alpha [Bacteroidota bacterium]
MKIGIPKEIRHGETRVALLPSMVSLLKREGHEISVEAGAGVLAGASDDEFKKSGARIAKDAKTLYRQADIVFKVQPPGRRTGTPKHEAELIKRGGYYIGFLAPLENQQALRVFAKRKATSFSMEYVPRISRAQSMDALSSMATVAGYKAVLMAAEHLGKMFPLLMTAAGTVHPASVLVLGAGVAGLQAIATAKRLGAKVEAFDPRPAVKEQVKSLGAGFVDMEVPEDVETTGGYAKELSAAFLKKEQETIAERLPKVDVVISTAQVFGKRAPVLVTAKMVKKLHPGSIIVDLAAEQGGNCELTRAGKTVIKDGVAIMGVVNLPARVPVHASQMYAKNVVNLFQTVFPKGATTPNFEDEVTQGSCITREGELVNDSVRKALSKEGKKK